MPFDPSKSFEVVEEPPASTFDPGKPFTVVQEPSAFDPSKPFTVVDESPSMRTVTSAPGEAEQGRAPLEPLTPVPQAFPAKQQAQAQEMVRQQGRQPAYPALGKGDLVSAGRQEPPAPEAEIQPIGQPGSVLYGASEVAASVLNRPEYLAAMLNPATAAAVALRFAPGVAKQFVEDLGKAAQGDDQALGRAAAIGIPALAGGIKSGKTITERLRYQTELERAQAASKTGSVDALARQELKSPPTAKPEPLLKESDAELAKIPGERKDDASQISPPTEVHGNVQPLQEPAEELPITEGQPRVQLQTDGGIPEASPDDSAAKATPQELPRDVTKLGDSEFVGYLNKIVNGEPVTLFHGTTKIGLSELNPNSSLTTSRTLAEKFGKGNVYETTAKVPQENLVVDSAKRFLDLIKSGRMTEAEAELEFSKTPSEIKLPNAVEILKSEPPKEVIPPNEEVKTQEKGIQEVAPVPEAQPAGEAPAGAPELIGMGGAVPGEFRPSSEGATAMKYRQLDAERAQRGLEPLVKPEGKTDQAVWDKAMAEIDADPALPDRLISELQRKPRPIEDWENHVLLLRKIDLRNEYAKSTRDIAQAFDDKREQDLVEAKARRADWSDKLTELETASLAAGSERGRALRALQVMANEDFTLASMEQEMRGAVGGRRLTPREMADVERIQKEYEEKTAALEKTASEADRRRVEAESRAVLSELGRQAAEAKVPPPHIQKIVQRIGEVLHTRGDAARERLRGKLFTLSPEVLKDLAEVGADNLFTVGEDVARWTAKMISDIGEHVRPHLEAVLEASRKLYQEIIDAQAGVKKAPKSTTARKTSETVKATIRKTDTPEQKQQKLTERITERVKEGKTNTITASVQQLARAFVEQGVTGREALIDAVHGVLEGIIPDWTRRHTMDAISGYGDYRMLSKDEVSVKLRDLKGQMQQIAKLEDMAGGTAPLRSGVERREVTKAQADLIKIVNDAKRKGGYETTDPNTQLRTALDEVKKRTQTAIDEYERRIREEDYSVRKLSPIKPDDELTSLQATQARLRKKWDQMKREKELENRKPWQKFLDKFVRLERGFKLSSPVVFGKLAAAALTRVAEIATTETVGVGIGKLPGIRAVAKQAPREGGFSVKSFAAGLKGAITKGMADAAQTARTGTTNLEAAYGEKLVDRDWMNFFGRMHGAFKAPVKRFETELALQKRIEHAVRNGIDPSNSLVMARLITESLDDGYRAIFMQHGFSSDFFNRIVGQMEKSKQYQPQAEITARALRFLLPVVRVPANIVAETATGAYGAPLASARVMTHAIRGTLDSLEPKVADSIMRQFKKGSIGLGLMAIGYFNPQMVGGYDWREKRRPGEVKTAGFQIGGADIPRWLTHAPWFELMQIGATISHVKDQHVHGQPKGLSEGMWAAGLGLIEETPFVNEMLHADKLFDPNQRSQYVGEMLKSTLEPQMLIKAAELSDTDVPDSMRRKPKTVPEHIEMGIPGLRQNVPIKPKR